VDQYSGMTGLMLMVGGLGSISAALPLTYLVVLTGWRNAFIGIGVFSFVLALICWAIIRDTPEEKGWPSPGFELAPKKEAAVGFRKKVAMIGGSLSFWMIFLSTFFSGGASISFQGLWSIPYLMDVFGLDRLHAGSILMLLPLGFAFGGPTLGFLVERLHLNHKRVLLGSLAITSLGWTVMLSLDAHDSVFIPAALLFIFGFTGGGTLPLYYTITRDLFPAWLMGTASGLMNAAAFLGAALYQPLTGYLLEGYAVHSGVFSFAGYRLLLSVFLGSYFIAFIAMLVFKAGKMAKVTPLSY
jgi:sugar phosphate permease